jgi:hypothetical protein
MGLADLCGGMQRLRRPCAEMLTVYDDAHLVPERHDQLVSARVRFFCGSLSAFTIASRLV